MLTPSDFLRELQRRGVTRVSCVRFRENRSTVWSLTQRGTVLNVHSAFRGAPTFLLDSFATLAIEGGVASVASRKAARSISEWPELAEAIQAARGRRLALGQGDSGGGPTHCTATPDQRAYLRALYGYFNQTRFHGTLPHDVPVRLSHRMKAALGHMLPGQRPDGSRCVIEVALNVDLMLDGNGAERLDTLLHEMAHVADYLESGNRGHGKSWKDWARRVGCRPTTLYDRPVMYRPRRQERVTRVPPLPPALALRAESSSRVSCLV